MRKHPHGPHFLTLIGMMAICLPVLAEESPSLNRDLIPPGELKPDTRMVLPGDFNRCGLYRLTGVLRVSDRGHRTLEMYPDTSARYFIELFGLDGEDALKFKDSTLAVEAEIPKLRKNMGLFAKVTKLLPRPVPRDRFENAVTEMKTAPCKN